MQVRAPAWMPRLGVGNDTVPGHHEAKQAGLRRTRFAANTGAKRFLPRLRQLSSCGHYISSLPRHHGPGTRRGPGNGNRSRESSSGKRVTRNFGPPCTAIGVRDPGSLRRRGRGSYDRGSRDQPRGPGHPGVRNRWEPSSSPGGTSSLVHAGGAHTIAVPAIRPPDPDIRGVRDPREPAPARTGLIRSQFLRSGPQARTPAGYGTPGRLSRCGRG